MKKLILLLAFLPALSIVLHANPAGRIEYLQGEVTLLRDGEITEGYQINSGDPLYLMDVIETGNDGYVEVLLTSGGRTTVRIRENTAYYVEAESRTGGGTRTRLRILTGSVEMAVHQVARNSTIDVETRNAVLGVRGTEFDVLTAPDESTLAGVRSGVIELNAGGRQARVEAGLAVDVPPEGAPTGAVVPGGDFDRYYETWINLRLQAFRSGAATFNLAYARRYRDTEPGFQAAYQDLMRHRDALRDAAHVTTPGLGSDMRLRTEVSPAIIRMRSILPLFENTVYRLRELDRFHRQGIGVTRIDNESSAEFFQRFSRDERRLMRQLSEVRTIFRHYQQIEQRSFGGLPGGESLFGGPSPIDSMRF